MKLICLSYQMSHFIPIMNYLMNHNMTDCVFFGDNSLEEYVTQKGLEFVSCKSTDFMNILKYREQRESRKIALAYKELHEEIKCVIDKYYIEELYCDISRYMFYAPAAYQKCINVTIFWTYNCPTHFNFYSYPQTVYAAKSSCVKCCKEWIRKFYIGEIKSKKIYSYFFYPYRILFHPKNLFKIRYSIDGLFINTNKIVCGPVELASYYDNKTVFDKSKISYFPNDDIGEIGKLLECEKIKIYITLGTNNMRYQEGVNVINHIITCLGDKHDFLIITNIGNEEEGKFIHKFNNVTYVKDINQIQIIKEVDCVVFHGGYGTFKECYYFRKKMIIIPFYYDQFANANLAEKMKIGSVVKVENVKNTDFFEMIKHI